MRAGRLTKRQTMALSALFGVGVLLRLGMAFKTSGQKFDVASYEIVWRYLQTNPLHLYSIVNVQLRLHGVNYSLYRWPYLPGFLPWIAAAHYLHSLIGGASIGFIKLPSCLADAGLAWLVEDFLGRRGRSGWTRVTAAALIMAGPSFFLVSGYAAQFDALAILPAAVGVCIWERAENPQRALLAGALIGLGAELKIIPILFVLALMPTACGWGERAKVAVAAVIVPLAFTLPYLVTDPRGILHLSHYAGVPGLGGLGMFVQPHLAGGQLRGSSLSLSVASLELAHYGGVLTAAAVAAVTLFLWRKQIPATLAAAILMLTIYVAGSGFAFQYLVWGLPFLLLAGELVPVAVIQAIALTPSILFYATISFPHVTALYVSLMTLLYATFAWLLYGYVAQACNHVRPLSLLYKGEQ